MDLARQHQTVFGPDRAPPGSRGNCLAAAIASAFRIPLEDVPHFMGFDDWEGQLRDWLKDLGIGFIWMGWDESWTRNVDGALAVVIGDGGRDYTHAVVWRVGSGMVWDPHPSGLGIYGEPRSVILFVSLEPWRLTDD